MNKQDSSKDKFPSAVDFYRCQRGLTKTELSRLTGIRRGKIQDLCEGEFIRPKDLNLLARTLCVTPQDLNRDWTLEQTRNNAVDVAALIELIDTDITKLKPRQISSKAEWFAAYLATEDPWTEKIMDYLLFHAGTMGLLILSYCRTGHSEKSFAALPKIPRPLGKRAVKSYKEAAAPPKKETTKLALYMKYRNIKKETMAKKTGLTRQTIGAACGKKTNLANTNLEKVAQVLYVDPQDLTEGNGVRLVNIPFEKEKIHLAMNGCDPNNLKRKIRHLKRLLETDTRHESYGPLTRVMANLLSEPDEDERKSFAERLLRLKDNALSRTYFFRDSLSEIVVGYQDQKDSPGEYRAFVALDDWVHELFDLPIPVRQVETHPFDILDRLKHPRGKITYQVVDMPVICLVKAKKTKTGKRWGKDDLEGAILDAVEEYLWNHDIEPELAGLYEEFLDRHVRIELNNPYVTHISEFTDNDSFQKLWEAKIRSRGYRQSLEKLWEDTGHKPDIFINTTADLFAGIVTSPETEEERLAAYWTEESIDQKKT